MFPIDKTKDAIPDGYSITSELPPQSSLDEAPLEEILQSEEALKSIVGAHFFISFCFNVSMNILYAMINSLQITAHLPLNNISFTSNVMETFDFLIAVVTFDFFEVKDYIAFGFTESDPWTYRFHLLDYESFNFIENLGSISIFIVIYLLWVTISLILKFAGLNLRFDWLKTRMGRIYITQSIFRFFLETYFELLISSVLFIGMIRTRDIWNASDKIAVAL